MVLFMTQDTNILYTALLNRDSSLDGKVYYGVTSTGIFCRPVCPANKPKRENTLFFTGQEEALLAGFRPCLRCRPEVRPGSPAWEGTQTTVKRALRLISSGEDNVQNLADKLGVTDRHLRRLFQKYLGKSPNNFITAHRLQLACGMLENTSESIADIAFSAGWNSLRRFNTVFRDTYGTTPRDWRNQNRYTDHHSVKDNTQ